MIFICIIYFLLNSLLRNINSKNNNNRKKEIFELSPNYCRFDSNCFCLLVLKNHIEKPTKTTKNQ